MLVCEAKFATCFATSIVFSEVSCNILSDQVTLVLFLKRILQKKDKLNAQTWKVFTAGLIDYCGR